MEKRPYIFQTTEYGIEVFKVIIPKEGKYEAITRMSEEGARRLLVREFPTVNMSKFQIKRVNSEV